MKHISCFNSIIAVNFIICLFVCKLSADIKSSSGEINFDVQSDEVIDMKLNTTGLGIGTDPTEKLSVAGNAVVSGQLNVGSSTGGSNLSVTGSVEYTPLIVTSDVVLDSAHIVMVNASSDNIRVTLPYAGNVNGRTYHIKKINRDNLVIVKGGGNLIDDAEAIEMKHDATLGYPSLSVVSSLGQWWKIYEAYNYDIIAAENLIRWYKLDETTGTHSTDDSESDIAGTLLGGFTAATSSVTGLLGQALNFDATDNRVEYDDLDIPTNQKFSISLWMSTTGSQSGANGNGYLIQKDRYTGSTPYAMYVSGSNYYTSAVSGDAINSTTTVNDGDWHNCVLVIDGTTMSNYLDGQFQASTGVTHDEVNDDLLAIGASDDTPSYRPFSGNIDDVRIFSKALSASEVLKLYEASLDE